MPEKEVGLNPQEGLTKTHEASNVKDGIWCELMKLHTINKKKPMKKFVGRKRKTAEEEGEEHHPVTARGLWDPLSAWKLDGILAGDEAICPRLLHLLLLDRRSHPVSRGDCRFSLGHDVLRCKVLHAHLNLCLGAMREKRQMQRLQWRWWRRRRAGKQ
jgi:hypothetical protein